MAVHTADIHALAAHESLGVITADELAEARRDPDVIALLRDADAVLAARKAARALEAVER